MNNCLLIAGPWLQGWIAALKGNLRTSASIIPESPEFRGPSATGGVRDKVQKTKRGMSWYDFAILVVWVSSAFDCKRPGIPVSEIFSEYVVSSGGKHLLGGCPGIRYDCEFCSKYFQTAHNNAYHIVTSQFRCRNMAAPRLLFSLAAAAISRGSCEGVFP